MDVQVPDHQEAIAVLCRLPIKLEHFIVAIDAVADNNKPYLELVKSGFFSKSSAWQSDILILSRHHRILLFPTNLKKPGQTVLVLQSPRTFGRYFFEKFPCLRPKNCAMIDGAQTKETAHQDIVCTDTDYAFLVAQPCRA